MGARPLYCLRPNALLQLHIPAEAEDFPIPTCFACGNDDGICGCCDRIGAPLWHGVGNRCAASTVNSDIGGAFCFGRFIEENPPNNQTRQHKNRQVIKAMAVSRIRLSSVRGGCVIRALYDGQRQTGSDNSTNWMGSAWIKQPHTLIFLTFNAHPPEGFD